MIDKREEYESLTDLAKHMFRKGALSTREFEAYMRNTSIEYITEKLRVEARAQELEL